MLGIFYQVVIEDMIIKVFMIEFTSKALRPNKYIF